MKRNKRTNSDLTVLSPNQSQLPHQRWPKLNFKKKIASVKIEKISCQIIIAALMQPFHYDLPCPAAEDNSITHAVMQARRQATLTPWRSHYNAICTEAIAKRPTVEDVETKLSCKTSFKFQQFKPSFEKEAFVRDFLQFPTVEDVETKLSCETSFNFQQFKM